MKLIFKFWKPKIPHDGFKHPLGQKRKEKKKHEHISPWYHINMDSSMGRAYGTTVQSYNDIIIPSCIFLFYFSAIIVHPHNQLLWWCVCPHECWFMQNSQSSPSPKSKHQLIFPCIGALLFNFGDIANPNGWHHVLLKLLDGWMVLLYIWSDPMS